jgi:hypothetical protein
MIIAWRWTILGAWWMMTTDACDVSGRRRAGRAGRV